MAAGALDFLINVKQQLTGGNVVSELSKLEAKIKGEAAALAQLEATQKRMQKGSSVDIEAYKKVQGAIDEKKSSISDLSGQLSGLVGKQGEAGEASEGLGSKLAALKAGPVGAVIAAVVALITVIAVVTYKIMAFVASAADAARSFKLVLEGATGSAAAAGEAADAIERVGRGSALAKGELQEMARGLLVAKLNGKLFEDTLRSIATVSSVAGSEAASHIQEIAEKSAALGHFEFNVKALKGLGISMGDVAKKMGISVVELDAQMKAGKITTEKGLDAINAAVASRFGGVAAKQLLGLDVQFAKAKENFTGLFAGVNIEPFLVGLHEVLGLVDSSTASGKALKFMFTEVFSGLFAVAGRALPYVKALLQGMLIVGLELYIALKPLVKTLIDALGISSGGSADGMAAMVTIGKVLAVVILVIATVLIASWTAMVAFIGTLSGLGGLLLGAVTAFVAFGSGIVSGLVDGITGGIGKAVAAVKQLGSSVLAAMASVLDSHSPSRKFGQFGKWSVEGYTNEIEAGTDGAQGAVSAMVAPPEAGGPRGGGRGARGAGGPLIGTLILQGGNAAEIWAQLEPRIIALLEGAELSGPEPEGAT